MRVFAFKVGVVLSDVKNLTFYMQQFGQGYADCCNEVDDISKQSEPG